MKTKKEIEERVACYRGLYVMQLELARIYKAQGDSDWNEHAEMMSKQLHEIVKQLEWVLD